MNISWLYCKWSHKGEQGKKGQASSAGPTLNEPKVLKNSDFGSLQVINMLIYIDTRSKKQMVANYTYVFNSEQQIRNNIFYNVFRAKLYNKYFM